MATLQNKYLNLDEILTKRKGQNSAVANTAENDLQAAQNTINQERQSIDNSIGYTTSNGEEVKAGIPVFNDKIKEEYNKLAEGGVSSGDEFGKVMSRANTMYSGPDKVKFSDVSRQTTLGQMLGGSEAQRKVAGKELTGGNYSTLDDILNVSQNRGKLAQTAQKSKTLEGQTSQLGRAYEDKIKSTKQGVDKFRNDYKNFLGQNQQNIATTANQTQQEVLNQNPQNQAFNDKLTTIKAKLAAKRYLSPNEIKELEALTGFNKNPYYKTLLPLLRPVATNLPEGAQDPYFYDEQSQSWRTFADDGKQVMTTIDGVNPSTGLPNVYLRPDGSYSFSNAQEDWLSNVMGMPLEQWSPSKLVNGPQNLTYTDLPFNIGDYIDLDPYLYNTKANQLGDFLRQPDVDTYNYLQQITGEGPQMGYNKDTNFYTPIDMDKTNRPLFNHEKLMKDLWEYQRQIAKKNTQNKG